MPQHSDETIAAALRPAAERWGGQVTINGSAAFKERARHIAIELGIRVRNRELQDAQGDVMEARRNVQRENVRGDRAR